MKRPINLPYRCSLVASLNEIGHWWSLLIVREAIMGIDRFEDFLNGLGMARNVLTDRLEHLVQHGVMNKEEVPEDGRAKRYMLTEKGYALYPVIAALLHWGDDFVHRNIGAPVKLVDKRTGQPVKQMRITTAQGKPIHARHIAVVAGPGADKLTRYRLEKSIDN